MLHYDLDILKKCANNLMFDMSDEQYQVLEKEFEVITKQMELLGELDGLEDVEPMTFPYQVFTSFIREDEAGECLTKEEALSNAKDVFEGQIKLPKVVG